MSNRTLACDEDWQAGGAMGDVIEVLHKEGHISDRGAVVAYRLLEDMRRSHGTSDGIFSTLCERVQTSRKLGWWRPPGGGDLDAFARMDKAVSALKGHERQTMAYLIRQREMTRGTLEARGRVLSGYTHARAARAYMTGRIVALIDTITEVYPVAET